MSVSVCIVSLPLLASSPHQYRSQTHRLQAENPVLGVYIC